MKLSPETSLMFLAIANETISYQHDIWENQVKCLKWAHELVYVVDEQNKKGTQSEVTAAALKAKSRTSGMTMLKNDRFFLSPHFVKRNHKALNNVVMFQSTTRLAPRLLVHFEELPSELFVFWSKLTLRLYATVSRVALQSELRAFQLTSSFEMGRLRSVQRKPRKLRDPSSHVSTKRYLSYS